MGNNLQKHVGRALQKFLKQGLCDWNGMIRVRKYWMEPVHFVGADEHLKLFEAAEIGETILPDNAPGISQRQQNHTPTPKPQRRW